MCRKKGKLRMSHLMSRALYSFCRREDFPPVQITPDAATITTKQTKAYLLCPECDGSLNLKGERWLFPRLPVLHGAFPLYDSLMKGQRLWNDAERALYATAGNPEIDADKLTHFALGMFWKASLYPWNPRIAGPSIDLGAAGETLRCYLRGECDLTSRIALTVTVDSSPIKLPALHPPYQSSHRDFDKSFHFFVPGILFNLLIGDNARATAGITSITESPYRAIIVEEIAKLIRSVFREGGANAVPSKKLVENNAKNEALGLNIKLGD